MFKFRCVVVALAQVSHAQGRNTRLAPVEGTGETCALLNQRKASRQGCGKQDLCPTNKKDSSKNLIYRILGPKLGYREVPVKFKIGKDSTEYQIVNKITTYRNGTETESSFDGCDDDDYLFYHLSFAQTYHLMVLSEYFSFNTRLEYAADNNYMGVPRLFYSSANDYEFDGLSGSDNIYIKKDGIEISFSLCD